MRRGILPLFGFALCCGIAITAFPAPVSAQTLTGTPPVASDPLPMPPEGNAQGQPVDLVGPPPPDATPPAAQPPVMPPLADANAMPATPVGPVPVPPDAPLADAPPSPEGAAPGPASAPSPSIASAPAVDPASACPGSASDASDCLKRLDDQTMVELDRVQTDKLKALRKGSDWKQGRTDSQSLANSAMSFEAYRDSECAREKKGHEGDEADNIFMSCQIKMSQDRIALLQRP